MAMNGQGHRVPHAGDVRAHARADGGPGACCGPVVPHGQRVRAARAQARALRAPDAVSAALAAGRRGHEAAIDSGERECSSPTDSACCCVSPCCERGFVSGIARPAGYAA
jgi:hypothetical protein